MGPRLPGVRTERDAEGTETMERESTPQRRTPASARAARVGAVLACHNRREKTLACLDALRRQAARDDVDAHVTAYVVDDGSTDGTAEAVARRHPDAVLLHGDGDLYWNGGMRVGLDRAYADDHDFYLWLNDDTELDDDALAVLLRTAAELRARGEPPAIVVGSTRDPETGALTYGGRHRPSRVRRLQYAQVPPADHPKPTETMNGNIVLVPREVVRRVGNIDAAYRHGFGDEDYGFRAWAAGCSVWLAPGTLGACARNPRTVYGRRPLREELRDVWGPKGLQPAAWATYTRRWAGPLWPVYWVSPYVQRGLRILAAHRR